MPLCRCGVCGERSPAAAGAAHARHRRRRHDRLEPRRPSRRRRLRGRRAGQLRPRPDGQPGRRARPRRRSRWSTGTSATARCWPSSWPTWTWSSTSPRSGSPSAPRSRGSRSRCWSTARSTCSRPRPRPACARSSHPRRPRRTGWPTAFPTPEDHHPYANDTLYGAAKVFNEGLLRSFHSMYGLDYVALRYFNVYGPRMDVHGLYTEVLIRWMERIERGEPPLIFGDGSQTMDFVHVRDVARSNILAAQADVTDDVFNVASAGRDQPARAGRDAAAGDGLRPVGRARAAASGQRRHPAARRHQQGGRADSGSGPRSASRRACTRSSTGGGPSGPPASPARS